MGLDLKTNVDDVLADMAKMATQAAKSAGADAVQLAQRATDLTAAAIAISDPEEKLEALESIGHGMKSGLAAIANREARDLLDGILARSLGFAKSILGGLLGKF